MKDIKPSSKRSMGTISSHGTLSKQKKQPRPFLLVIITIFLSLIVGACAGIIGTRLILPFLVTLPYFEESQLVAPEGTEVVIEKKEVVEVKEGGGVEEAVRKVGPSVVTMVSENEFEDVVGDIEKVTGGISGFILTADGLIVTNKHYVDDLTEKYYVILADGTKYTVNSIVADPLLDVAYVSIDADSLPVVELGVSDDLSKGERVIALGESLTNRSISLSQGIIDSLNQTVTSDAVSVHDALVSNITLSEAHAGSPLVTPDGKVIGINVVMDLQDELLYYTIPIDYIKSGYQDMIKSREIKRPYVGIQYMDVTPEFAALNSLSVKHGALLYATTDAAAVKKGSPAFAGGLKAQDIITRVNGEELTDVNTFLKAHLALPPTDDITFTILRDNQQREVVITPDVLEE